MSVLMAYPKGGRLVPGNNTQWKGGCLSLLDKLATEQGRGKERKAEVEKAANPNLAKLDKAFWRFVEPDMERDLRLIEINKKKDHDFIHLMAAAALIKKIGISARDLELWSLALPAMIEESGIRYSWNRVLGFFLSAAVYIGKGKHFVIHTSALDGLIDYLGFANRKHLTVVGPAGDWCGVHMAKGTMIIEGDVSYYCGSMEGGILIVKGNACERTAEGMQGGILRIEGSIGGFGKPEGGSIYHKGNLVFSESRAKASKQE